MSVTSVLAGTEKTEESLKDKIGAAFDSLEGIVEEPKKTEKVVETPVEDEEIEDEIDEDETPTDDLNEDEKKEALVLYKALKNPDQAAMIARELATRYSIQENKPIETKAEIKAAKKDIQELLKEHLGKELHDLVGEKIGKALEAAFEQEREENSEKIQSIERDNLVKEADRVKAKMNRETQGDFTKRESQMTRLMEKFQPSPDMGLEEYMRGIYKMASADSAKANGKTEVTKKIKENSKDAPGRLHSAGGGGGREKDMKVSDKIKSPKDAVRFAMAQLESEGKQ